MAMGLEQARRWVSETLTGAPPDGLHAAFAREDGAVEVVGPNGKEYLVTITEKP
jgi:hypothetical protein